MNLVDKFGTHKRQEAGFIVVWLSALLLAALSPFWLVFAFLPVIGTMLLFLISLAPNALIYMTIFAIPYVIWKLLLPHVARRIPIFSGLVIAVFTGLLLPLWMNAQTRAAVEEKRNQSFGQLGVIPPVGGIALLTSRSGGANLNCEKACQELIALPAVTHVIVGDGRRLHGSQGSLIKYARVPIEDCQEASRHEDMEMTSYRYALGRRAEPICLFANYADSIEADIVHVRIQDGDPRSASASSGSSMFKSGVTEELQTREGGSFRVVARRLRFDYRIFNIPLWIAQRGSEHQPLKVGWSAGWWATFNNIPSRNFDLAAASSPTSRILDWFSPVP